MGNSTISQLPAGALTGANVDVDADFLVIDDTSAVNTKRITPKELLANSASFLQSGAGAVARTAQDKARDIVSVMDYVPVGNAGGDGTFDGGGFPIGGTDYLAAFQAAHDALSIYGGQITIPRAGNNIWRLSGPLNITKPIRLTGQLSSASATRSVSGTVLIFDADNSGIIANGWRNFGYTVVAANDATPGANYSILENFAVFSAGRTNGLSGGGTGINVDGIFITAPGVVVRNVWSHYWRRSGVRVVANAAVPENANLWRMDTVNCQFNGDDGLFLDGDSVNAGVGININCSNNLGWGFNDSGFLGNTYIGCHADSNTLGSYKTDNANAQHIFIGCYSEPPSDASLVSPTIVIGGLLSAEGSIDVASTAFVMGGGAAYRKPFLYTNSQGAVTIGCSVGEYDSSLSALTFGTSVESATFNAWKLKFDNTNNAWYLQYANSGSFEPIAFINSTHSRQAVGTGPILGSSGNAGYYIGTRAAPILRGFAAAAPVAGAYVVGDIVYNNAPAAGGTIGWVCTAAGSPGTWKTWGVIAA